MAREIDGALKWRVQTPELIREMVKGNPGGWALIQPANIFLSVLAQVAERAIALDDPELNVLMLRLGLYDVPPLETSAAIHDQERRISAE